MLVVDQLKKNEPQLRLVAVVLAAGLFILFIGLWWVQVVSVHVYQSHLETQSYRTVRLPAVRGKILEREGRVLAENRPSYNLSIYLNDLSDRFKAEYKRIRPVKVTAKVAPFWEFWNRGKTWQTNRVRLSSSQIDAVEWQSRLDVVQQVVADVSQKLEQPLKVDAADFKRHYMTRLALPFPVLKDMTPEQLARFEENTTNGVGAELDLQSVRRYPLGTMASHLLGYLRRDDRSYEGEDSSFSYRLPDYRGVLGIEYAYDNELRGRAGAESVLVNNLGYRQSENIWTQPEPGQNVVLTLDLDLQQVVENSLQSQSSVRIARERTGGVLNAAVVVMDVRNGSVLAMASSPAYDPNDFADGISQAKWNQIQQMTAEKNRATAENYAPGSIFKPIVGLAALETGLNPNAYVDNPGYIYVGRRHITDLASPGKYNFRKAIMDSSNTYFITVGLRAGIENILRLAEKFHFGERCSIPTRQETDGNLPTFSRVQQGWTDGDTANVCIGQGEVAVTPLQMAVAYSAIANGGTVFWPRFVLRIESPDPMQSATATNLNTGLVRDRLGVSPRNLRVLRDAMLAETEDPGGTGGLARVPGLHICGKTGTAEIMDTHNRKIGRTTWFASFAPYENPRYAVVVMVENGTFGGPTCGPIAHDIYQEILRKETGGAANAVASTTN